MQSIFFEGALRICYTEQIMLLFATLILKRAHTVLSSVLLVVSFLQALLYILLKHIFLGAIPL